MTNQIYIPIDTMSGVYHNGVSAQMHIVDNVFVKMHHFPKAGIVYDGHVHAFDHITLLARGKVLMKHDGGEQEFTAPQIIVTPKGIAHQFTALEENTVFCCIHAIREGDELDSVASPDISKDKAWELLTTYSVTVKPDPSDTSIRTII
jgi:quercetin dioxygenase-like cupin family protein